MLYLVTGLPGAGKTNYVVSQLAHSDDFKNRALYVDGIDELDHDKIQFFDPPEGCDGTNWHDWLPDGSIYVIDEAQRYFRPRSSTSRPPLYVTELETHRHRGVDIILITQSVRLLDSNVRAFIENHKHISKSQLGNRRIFEWQKAANPDNSTDVNNAIVTMHKLDKSVYSYYKSASEHTKLKTKRSRWVYVLPVLLVFIVLMTFVSIHMFKSQALTSQTDSSNGSAVSPPPSPVSTPSVNYKTEFAPRTERQPWTAPAYDNLRTVKSMPYPAGCIFSAQRGCRCFSSQSTYVAVDDKFCFAVLQARVFNPYKSNFVASQDNDSKPVSHNNLMAVQHD